MQDNYKQMYEAIWQFHKRHINNTDSTDKFWNGVHDEAVAIGKQFNNHPLIKALLIAEWDEFARVMRENETEENNEDDKPP